MAFNPVNPLQAILRNKALIARAYIATQFVVGKKKKLSTKQMSNNRGVIEKKYMA